MSDFSHRNKETKRSSAKAAGDRQPSGGRSTSPGSGSLPELLLCFPQPQLRAWNLLERPYSPGLHFCPADRAIFWCYYFHLRRLILPRGDTSFLSLVLRILPQTGTTAPVSGPNRCRHAHDRWGGRAHTPPLTDRRATAALRGRGREARSSASPCCRSGVRNGCCSTPCCSPLQRRDVRSSVAMEDLQSRRMTASRKEHLSVC